MSATQTEREKFIAAVTTEGLPYHVARLVLRHAATIQRCAEEECSSEAADRDRVPCPGEKVEGDCICDYDHDAKRHSKVTRIARQSQRCEKRIAAICEPFKVAPVFQGDPRGCCVKLQVPSGRTDDWGRTGLCVPA